MYTDASVGMQPMLCKCLRISMQRRKEERTAMEVLLSFVQYGAIFLLLASVSILSTVAGIILWRRKNAGTSAKEKESSAEDSKKEQ